MADVSIQYNGATIAEMSESGTKTLKTKGCYCAEDIAVTYSPSSTGGGETNCKIYEITLAKASGWILLTTLDAEVVEHINDASLVVCLSRVSAYAYEWYAGSMFIASNTPWGYNGSYPSYGFSGRESSTTACQADHVYYPANNTNWNLGIGGKGAFCVEGDQYWIKPTDGFIAAGTYRLTFTW